MAGIGHDLVETGEPADGQRIDHGRVGGVGNLEQVDPVAVAVKARRLGVETDDGLPMNPVEQGGEGGGGLDEFGRLRHATPSPGTNLPLDSSREGTTGGKGMRTPGRFVGVGSTKVATRAPVGVAYPLPDTRAGGF